MRRLFDAIIELIWSRYRGLLDGAKHPVIRAILIVSAVVVLVVTIHQNTSSFVQILADTSSATCDALNVGCTAENTDWKRLAQLENRTCQDIHDFIARYPNGARLSTAQAMLDGSQLVSVSAIETIRLPLPEPGQAKYSPTEEEARQQTLDRATKKSFQYCQTVAAHGRLISSRLTVDNWNCELLSSGYTCGLEGNAECRVDFPKSVEMC